MKLARALVASMMVVALAVGLGAPAVADDRGIPHSVDELLRVYGITDEPADYVVVVDTSGSMMRPQPIYPAVRAVYEVFTRAIGDADHLAVVTFDTSAVVRFNGRMDAANRGAAASALPAEAKGARTDIGAALDAALERLERPDGAPVQTLIFLTDGVIDAPGSGYRTRGSEAWRQLGQRAERVDAAHSLAVYGAGLGGGQTDIDAVRDVFPRAKIVSLPSDQLAAFFAEAVQRAKVERLRLPVTQELSRNPVQAVVTAGVLSDTTELYLRFDSKLPHLGATVNLRGVTVSDAAGQRLRSTLVGGPRTVTIGPGRSSDATSIRVEVPGLASDTRVGQVPESRDFIVRVDATLEVEPANVLVKELGIDAAPHLVGPDPVRAERLHGIAYWMIGVGLALLALVLLFLRWVYRRFFAVPRLRGGVELPDGTIRQFRGKEEQVPNNRIEFNGAGSSAVFHTKRGQFTKPLSTRFPRLYVRRESGAVRIDSMGVARPIDEVGERISPPDLVVVGPTRLIVVSDGRKGK